ncbi:Uncharacterised protein [Mycobacteroides abscessus subsp. abscessus]|nr:Uncharacterised protein [Mycobacteroides abscessus subsp. abscessus]
MYRDSCAGLRIPFCRLTTTAPGWSLPASDSAICAVAADFTVTNTMSAERTVSMSSENAHSDAGMAADHPR